MIVKKDDIGIKWPNDIYYGSTTKTGGVIAKSSLARDDLIVVVGAGVNLDNQHPTVSVNQILADSGHPKLSQEIFLARVFNKLEQIIEDCNSDRFGDVERQYYKYWLHSNQPRLHFHILPT